MEEAIVDELHNQFFAIARQVKRCRPGGRKSQARTVKVTIDLRPVASAGVEATGQVIVEVGKEVGDCGAVVDAESGPQIPAPGAGLEHAVYRLVRDQRRKVEALDRKEIVIEEAEDARSHPIHDVVVDPVESDAMVPARMPFEIDRKRQVGDAALLHIRSFSTRAARILELSQTIRVPTRFRLVSCVVTSTTHGVL